jgi:hypothetical protein
MGSHMPSLAPQSSWQAEGWPVITAGRRYREGRPRLAMSVASNDDHKAMGAFYGLCQRMPKGLADLVWTRAHDEWGDVECLAESL